MIQFTVAGIPRPGGSKNARVIYGRDGKPVLKNGRPIVNVTESGKHTAEWRQNVAYFARQTYDGTPLIGALKLSVRFGVLKVTAPRFHTSKPAALRPLP